MTRMALEAVLSSTRPPYEVLIVDNDSRDATPSYLTSIAAHNPHVRVLLNDRNLGFAAANNQAVAQAQGRVVVLLNNDTIVTRGWLDSLIRHLEEPAVGLVGAVTNRICNEAEIPTNYRDYNGLVRFARRHTAAHAGRLFDIPVVTMFCAAMRKETWDAVGPLDEAFGVGTLEDDDYSRRIREAGLRAVCAEDVFVHHFGEATFGSLYVDGTYGQLQRANRDRFESKWGPWSPYARRLSDEYVRARERVRRQVEAATDPGSVIAVVSKGDPVLADLPSRVGWHFPGALDGSYAGFYPSDGAVAAQALREVFQRGATHFVLPTWSHWWLERYAELGQLLERLSCTTQADCWIYRLSDSVFSPLEVHETSERVEHGAHQGPS